MASKPSYPIPDAKATGTILRALREARGLTQDDLGRMLGVSKARISTIERDPAGVRFAQILSIIALLGGRLVLEERALQVGEPPGGEW
jgi:HTH-type transcriptional regulator/antitoxin HipB